MPTIEGDLAKPAGRFAVVAAKFNPDVVDRLVAGALEGFRKHGVPDEAVTLIRVPGAIEVPLVCRRLAASGKYAAVVALGAVIQGDTDHYTYVCQEAAAGVMRAGLDTGVPVIFGILTCQTDEQALARAGGEHGDKGYDAAVAAIEMANLLKKLP
ncbi:MAG: 6,7-dimethyl-8-ribityllumazine synthase [Gemmataceae bacterium]